MNVWHALSARAKGKVERPYRWLQDRIVRRCAREDVRNIEQGRLVLQEELRRYNERQVHSTTLEIPAIRLQKAKEEGNSFFKPFQLPAPYKSTKDIFCLHEFKKVNGYNQVSWKKQAIPLPTPLPPGTEVELHVIPSHDRTEVRIWHKEQVLKVVHYKEMV